MNKSVFKKYIKSYIINLSTEKQLSLLDNMIIVIELIKSEVTKNKVFCHDCKKWIDKSKIIKSYKKEIKEELTFSDAGYGDYIEFSDIEYLIHYEECPFCHNKKEVYASKIRTINEWSTQR
jgi:hypothetical protein